MIKCLKTNLHKYIAIGSYSFRLFLTPFLASKNLRNIHARNLGPSLHTCRMVAYVLWTIFVSQLCYTRETYLRTTTCLQFTSDIMEVKWGTTIVIQKNFFFISITKEYCMYKIHNHYAHMCYGFQPF